MVDTPTTKTTADTSNATEGHGRTTRTSSLYFPTFSFSVWMNSSGPSDTTRCFGFIRYPTVFAVSYTYSAVLYILVGSLWRILALGHKSREISTSKGRHKRLGKSGPHDLFSSHVFSYREEYLFFCIFGYLYMRYE